MSIQRYAQNAYFVTLPTMGKMNLGGFQFPRHCELSRARVFVFLPSELSKSTALTLKVCAWRNGSVVLATSNQVRIDKIPDWTDGMGWLGWLTFEFGDYNLAAGETYYLNLQPDDAYTETDTSFVGVKIDSKPEVYSAEGARSMQVAFFVKEFLQ